jgi:hypothetical protein
MWRSSMPIAGVAAEFDPGFHSIAFSTGQARTLGVKWRNPQGRVVALNDSDCRGFRAHPWVYGM